MSEKQVKLAAQRNTIILHFFAIALIAILLVAFLFLIKEVVAERNARYLSTVEKLNNDWGIEQTLQGPVLLIPYVDHLIDVDTITDKDGEEKTVTRNVFNNKTAVILPEKLNLDVAVKQEPRHKGIFQTQIYTADVSIKGNFDYGKWIDTEGEEENKRRHYQWDKAWLVLGLTDTKAVTQNTEITWSNSRSPLQPGTRLTDLVKSGFNVPLNSFDFDKKQTAHTFSLKLSFRGSESILFAPLGEMTSLKVKSNSEHINFQEGLLPNIHESADGVSTAHWEIPYLARNYPQHWIMEDEKHALNSLKVGLDIFKPISLYTQLENVVEYGILLMLLVLLSLWLYELVAKQYFHIIQYAAIGVALGIFYFALLALSEYMLFHHAYLIASISTVVLVGLYLFWMFKNKWHSLIIVSILIALYAVLYVLIQYEDYALLVGSGLLFVMIMIGMYATRNLQYQDNV